ncbi:hypothetical protein Tco_0886136 [Tanacetum coccineum]
MEIRHGVRDFKEFFKKDRTIHPNHLVGECPKLSRYQNQKAFVGGSWSDSDEDQEEKTNDEKCLMAKASNEARYFVSSSSSHHQGTSSHQHDDDVKTSRASTSSPTTYLNSLGPLNYQNYQMPSASEQTDETLFERQTTLLNQTQQMHKEMRGGFKSFGKALKGKFSKKKK